jgi:dipeptidyl aminopeptidase/acylaminoacyl peptidase
VRRVARFDINLPQGSRIVLTWHGTLSFSPDSKTLHYPTNYPQANTVYSRRVDELESRPFDVAKGLGNILYSPDGKWMWSNDNAKGAVVKLPASGGVPTQIAPMKMLFRGEWGSDGYIYWSDGLISPVLRTPADGGKTEAVSELDEGKQERTHRFARLLPGAKAVMFTVAAGDIESFDDARIDAVDLASRKRKTLIHGGTSPRYVPSGHIVYARGGSLYAAAIDVGRLEVTGTPVKVLDGVLMSINTGFAYFDVSPGGDLAYAAGPVENGGRRLYWVDRLGKETPIPMPSRSYLNPRLSPDGKQLAIEIEGPNHDLYTYDFDRAVMSRITTDGISHGPVWSPDGKRFAFRSWKGGRMSLAWMPSDRSGPDEGLLDHPAWHNAVSFSPDGKYLSFDQIIQGNFGIWMLPLTGERKPVPFVQAKSQTGAAKFSPDGKWVVYCSQESGKAEVYVQPWPGPGPKIQISSDGGWDPLWRADGKEIFYRNGSRMMAVAVSTGTSFQAGRPQILWEGEYTFGVSSSCGFKGATATSYDVSRDGQRFLMIKDNDGNTYSTKVVVVLNWVEELKRIVAGKSDTQI